MLLMGTVLSVTLSKEQGYLDQLFKEGIDEESSIVVMFGTFALVMTCLAWGLLLKPGIHPKKTLEQSENVVKILCYEMDSPHLDEMTKMDELCLVCLSEKYVHLEHCKTCNKCVRHFHVHSKFFNKCFGDANIRPYILFNFLSLVLCLLYLSLIGRSFWASAASEFLLGRLILTHKMMGLKVLTAFVMLEVYTAHVLERCLVIFNALGHGMTINEYANAQDYKYLFQAEAVKKGFDECTMKNTHKKVSFCRFLANPFTFFVTCSR